MIRRSLLKFSLAVAYAPCLCLLIRVGK